MKRSAAPLDCLPAREIVRLMNAADKKVAAAVQRALPQIARAIDVIADAIEHGGRLLYVGCGTSGRIAALDAAEVPPTFNTDPKLVQYVIAGGDRALGMAAEYREDSPQLGRRDISRHKPGARDVVVAIAASGRTPYTLAALEYASGSGATTVALVCVPGSPMARAAEIAIVTAVGGEIVAGSTRLKAGTAQKMVLNMLSTGAMVRLGRVYGNLMVNVHLSNRKLRERGISLLTEATGASREKVLRALRGAGDRTAVALVMLKSGASAAQAERRLQAAGGHVRRAVEDAKTKKSSAGGRRKR